MNALNDEYLLSEEAAIKQQLEELKSRVTQLHDDIPCLKQCSRLSDFLQKMYEIRLGLNQLEQEPVTDPSQMLYLSEYKSSGRGRPCTLQAE